MEESSSFMELENGDFSYVMLETISFYLCVVSLRCTKSVLGRVRNLCMLVLRLCCVMVASHYVVDTGHVLDLVKTMWSRVYNGTRQMTNKYYVNGRTRGSAIALANRFS